MHIVFLAAVPVAAVAFVLALFLHEVPLRDTSRHGASDVGGGFGMPETSDSTQQLQTAIARLFRSRGRAALADIWQRSGTTLGASDGWCIGAVYLRAHFGHSTSLDSIAARHRVPGPVLAPAFAAAREGGYLTGDDRELTLTASGQREIDRFTAAMRAWLTEELQDWDAADDQQLNEALDGIARRIIDDEPELGPRPLELAAAQSS